MLRAAPKPAKKCPRGGRVVRNRGQVGVCGTCMDARGITEAEPVEGTRKSSLAELATWTQWADNVIVF